MEPRFGHDFSRVRVHADRQAADSARAVKALAYTVGQDIVFGQSSYSPSSHGGRQLMAHELAHSIQQGAGSPGTVMQRFTDFNYGVLPEGWQPGSPTTGPRRTSPRTQAIRRDITVLDWGNSRNGFNIAGGLFHIGEIDASSVRNMVDQIEDSLDNPPNGECIGSLTIVGHGSPGQISVGSGTGSEAGRRINGGEIDPQSPNHNPNMRATLARLTPLFCHPASVTLRGCNVGDGEAGQAFVQQLATLWNVPVSGNVGVVRAGGWWTSGRWTTARP